MALVTESAAPPFAPPAQGPDATDQVAGIEQRDAAKALAASQTVTVIAQRGAWGVFDFAELCRYYDLFLTLAYRDIRLRYRQTMLGAVWVVLQPLIAAGVTTILFSRLGGFSSGKIPYFIFSFGGMIGWYVFSQTISKSGQVLVQNANLVSKIYFPRIILPLSTILSTFLDVGVSLSLLAIFMVSFHVVPEWTLITAPFWLILIVLMASGIGLFAGALMVQYRDVVYVLPLFLQYGMYVTPAGYSLAEAAKKAPKLFWFFAINPFSYMLEGLRWALFGPGNGAAMPGPMGIALAVGGSLLVFFGGALFFGHMQRRFADVI